MLYYDFLILYLFKYTVFIENDIELKNFLFLFVFVLIICIIDDIRIL